MVGVIETHPSHTFVFRWPWLSEERLITTVRGNDRPRWVRQPTRARRRSVPDQPGAIDAWAEALETWSATLAMLRAHLDFSVDLRPRG